MALKTLIRRFAGGPKPIEDALVVILPDAAAATAAATLIARLANGAHRLNVVPVAADRAVLAGLPSAPLIAPRVPWVPPLLPVRAVLAGLRARAIVVIGTVDGLAPPLSRLIAGARRRGLPVYLLAPATLARLVAGETVGPGLAAHTATAREAMPPEDAGFDAVARHLARSVGIERGEGALIDALAGRAQRALATPMLRRLGSGRVERIDTASALADRLGRPQTILCLGNGPTSADLRLAALPRDALFRVNHQWMAQGFLTNADMVFAGVKRSMRAAGRRPVGVATRRKERALLAARLLEFWHGPLSYTVVEDIAADIMPEVEGPLRPTTGAYMIAAAVALRPRRLIVAGMDLFSHPAGAYPNGMKAENAYTPSHDLETDAAFIRGCLAAYEGEIATLSPAFAELAGRVPAARFRLVEVGLCPTPA
ncbi:MAG: hypothetical protein RQ752_11440 [Thermohalobaculum sp.]|nr:hypothetical protein [Thermohalobaculum sp.]